MKNVFKKIWNSIKENDSVKAWVAAYKRAANPNSQETAFNDAEPVKKDLIDQITLWVIDEVQKLTEARKGCGFQVFIGTVEELRDQIKATQDVFYEVFLAKTKWFGRFKCVQRGCRAAAASYGQNFIENLMAQSCWVEKGDRLDAIIFYPEQMARLWTKVAKGGETIEAVVRQLVRHEFRHAEQVIELRRVGGSQLVVKVVEYDLQREYSRRVMERDAWEGQSLPEYRPISEFAQEALAAVA